MHPPKTPHTIVAVDRSDHGLVITFQCGRAALFSEELLYELLPRALLLPEHDNASDA